MTWVSQASCVTLVNLAQVLYLIDSRGCRYVYLEDDILAVVNLVSGFWGQNSAHLLLDVYLGSA